MPPHRAFELHPASLDATAQVEAGLAKAAAALSGARPAGPAPKGEASVRAVAPGATKSALFLDSDTFYWRLDSLLTTRGPAGERLIPPPGLPWPVPSSLQGRQWVVLCCENKLIFFDGISRTHREVPRGPAFGNTQFECCTPLVRLSPTRPGKNPWPHTPRQ